jgi:hypothetical protein
MHADVVGADGSQREPVVLSQNLEILAGICCRDLGTWELTGAASTLPTYSTVVPYVRQGKGRGGGRRHGVLTKHTGHICNNNPLYSADC